MGERFTPSTPTSSAQGVAGAIVAATNSDGTHTWAPRRSFATTVAARGAGWHCRRRGGVDRVSDHYVVEGHGSNNTVAAPTYTSDDHSSPQRGSLQPRPILHADRMFNLGASRCVGRRPTGVYDVVSPHRPARLGSGLRRVDALEFSRRWFVPGVQRTRSDCIGTRA